MGNDPVVPGSERGEKVHTSYALLGNRSSLGSRRSGNRLGIVPVGSAPTLAASLWVKHRSGWCEGPAGTHYGGGRPRPDYGLLNLTFWSLNIVNVRFSVFKDVPLSSSVVLSYGPGQCERQRLRGRKDTASAEAGRQLLGVNSPGLSANVRGAQGRLVASLTAPDGLQDKRGAPLRG